MRWEHIRILRYVAANGPVSCIDIAIALGFEQQDVYRFLYKARCYGNGKGWIDNQKPANDPQQFTTPGQYVITPQGQAQLTAALLLPQ